MRKGFIGPIGDDLPSLIPLIFSLIIFFAAFSSTLDTFHRTADRFDLAVTVLRISNALRGDKYINDADEFKSLCNNVTVRGVFFKAGLVELNEHFEPLDVYKFVNEDERIYESNGQKFKCPEASTDKLRKHNFVMVDMFPVAYQDSAVASGLAVRPMLLVVVVWK